jgi:NAD(P)-dependent dehydrogenase (short-subunit alcohol dehydrogenase family)
VSVGGKRVLVIGGETPVGRSIAIGLAEAGADVAIASRTTDTQADFAINSALNEVWAIDRKGVALVIDASDDDQVRGALDRTEAELGSIDGVFAVVEEFDAARLGAVFSDRQFLAVAPQTDAAAAFAQVIKSLES